MQIAQSGAADIILMDVSLAHSVYRGKAVDGIKITQLLKADAQTSNLPIILVTAHAMEGDRENFLKQSGADGYISKPVVDHQKLVDQILALLPKWAWFPCPQTPILLMPVLVYLSSLVKNLVANQVLSTYV